MFRQRLYFFISREKRLLVSFGLVIGLTSLFASIYAVNKVNDLRSKAAPGDTTTVCKGQINIQISTDGKSPSLEAKLPSNSPTKYYIHVTQAGRACSTNFDLTYQDCDKDYNNCTPFNNVATGWRNYRSSASTGIARIDLDKAWGGTLYRKLYLKPKGQNVVWSNEVRQTITPQTSTKMNTPIRISEYYNIAPGNTYIFDSVNKKPTSCRYNNTYPTVQEEANCNNEHFVGGEKVGTLILQMEEKIKVCSGPQTVEIVPWRYMKNNYMTYWAHQSAENLRFMMVDPNFTYKAIPELNNYQWVFGGMRFSHKSENDPLAIKDLGRFRRFNTYSTFGNGNYAPAYNFGLKEIWDFTYIEAHYGTETGFRNPVFSIQDTFTNCDLTQRSSSYSNDGMWKLRAEMDTITISNNEPGSFNYSGPALRFDQFEGSTDGAEIDRPGGFYLPNEKFHRESWYFVKGVGLVKVEQKGFNGFAGVGLSKLVANCESDSDCWADHMSDPNNTIQLKYFFPATTTFSISSLPTSNNDKLYLKIDNVPYTGWVEAEVTSDAGRRVVGKFAWADKGVLEPVVLSNYPAGSKIKLRMYIPDESFPNETRITSSGDNTPWSNVIQVQTSTNSGGTTDTQKPVIETTKLTSTSKNNLFSTGVVIRDTSSVSAKVVRSAPYTILVNNCNKIGTSGKTSCTISSTQRIQRPFSFTLSVQDTAGNSTTRTYTVGVR